MSTDLKWEAPPLRWQAGSTVKYREIADALRARPGDWAVIRECPTLSSATSTAHNIRRGTAAGFRPAEDFEIRSATPSGGPYRVYARYIGKNLRAVG